MPRRNNSFSSTASQGSKVTHAGGDVVGTFNHGDGILTAAVADGVDLLEELKITRATVSGRTEIGNVEKWRLEILIHATRRIELHVGWCVVHSDVHTAGLPRQVRGILIHGDARQS